MDLTGEGDLAGPFSKLCSTCNDERLDYLKRRARQELRVKREAKAAKLRSGIEKTIPPLFRKARLWKISSKLRAVLLGHNPKTGLVLYGPTGRGKSFAMCALLRYLIGQGQSAVRVGYERLCLEIRDTFKRDNNTSELDVIRPYLSPDVLLIEDLGAGKAIGSVQSDFSLRVIYVIVDHRLEQCNTTLITTNMAKRTLSESFDERIASRLSVMTWQGIGGKDKREKE